MKGNPEERAVKLAQYIVARGATVRGAAAAFGVSKSTVHKDVSQRLRCLNRALYEQTRRVLEQNRKSATSAAAKPRGANIWRGKSEQEAPRSDRTGHCF